MHHWFKGEGLLLSKHLSHLMCSCYFCQRAIRSVSSCLYNSGTCLICGHIDHCNALSAGLPKMHLSSLQLVMNGVLGSHAH